MNGHEHSENMYMNGRGIDTQAGKLNIASPISTFFCSLLTSGRYIKGKTGPCSPR